MPLACAVQEPSKEFAGRGEWPLFPRDPCVPSWCTQPQTQERHKVSPTASWDRRDYEQRLTMGTHKARALSPVNTRDAHFTCVWAVVL